MKIVTCVVAAALLCAAFPSSLQAQEGKEGRPAGESKEGSESKEGRASAAKAMQALVEIAKVRLDKAIGIALQARPGTAVGVEMEGAAIEGKGEGMIPVFEVMVCDKDQAVYEVFVNAVDGSIVSNEVCKDEEDVGEVKVLMARKGPLVSLGAVVAESGALLQGTCIGASLDAESKRAKTLTLNRGRRLAAEWKLSDGSLAGIKWVDGNRKKAAHEEEEEDEDEEGEEHEGGEHTEKEGGEKHEKKGGKAEQGAKKKGKEKQ